MIFRNILGNTNQVNPKTWRRFVLEIFGEESYNGQGSTYGMNDVPTRPSSKFYFVTPVSERPVRNSYINHRKLSVT